MVEKKDWEALKQQFANIQINANVQDEVAKVVIELAENKIKEFPEEKKEEMPEDVKDIVKNA